MPRVVCWSMVSTVRGLAWELVLFILVLEVPSREFHTRVRWQLLYQDWGRIRFIKYKYKYKYKYIFPEFQIQIHRQKSDQTQTQIQIPLIKYKEKNTNTQWDRDKIAAILQMTYQNLLYCKNIVLFIQISLKIVSKVPIYNKPTLLQIMAWRWVGNKPLSDQWWPGLLMHKCITRPNWVNVKRSVADCYLNVV